MFCKPYQFLSPCLCSAFLLASCVLLQPLLSCYSQYPTNIVGFAGPGQFHSIEHLCRCHTFNFLDGAYDGTYFQWVLVLHQGSSLVPCYSVVHIPYRNHSCTQRLFKLFSHPAVTMGGCFSREYEVSLLQTQGFSLGIWFVPPLCLSACLRECVSECAHA